MYQILMLSLLVVILWSIFTTIQAIYLISTKPFKGNKTEWIIIVMIGIIGPILWVTKGKKLIDSSEKSY